MNDFMATCFYLDGPVIDQFCEDFDVDIEEEEFLDCIKECCPNNLKFVGRSVLIMLWGKVVDKYKQYLDVEKFDYDVSSPSYPCFYYDGEHITCKEDLDKIEEELEDEKEI